MSKPRATGVPQTASQLDKLERHLHTHSDRIARLESNQKPMSGEALREAVVAEFDPSTLRLGSVPKDFRALQPSAYEAQERAAWERIAKRLSNQGTQ